MQKGAVAPKRREFIPGIREMIAKSIPVAEHETNRIIDRWRDGEAARTPLEHGIFEACDTVARDLDQRAAGEA